MSLITVALLGLLLGIAFRRRHMQYWVGSYLGRRRMPAPVFDSEEPVEVYLALCDHYEPECYGADHQTALARVRRWVHEYPCLFERFCDSNGRPPQHTFFFPQDEYQPEYLDLLKELCDDGYGDVDIHLHHDGDTAEELREKLDVFREILFHRHGLLRRHPVTGEVVYGFIHGNWALCNSRPDRRYCGVDQELTVLMQTGCYADFTMPSAPSPTQTRTLNSIYYAQDVPGCCKSHDSGVRARVGQAPPEDHLLMVQGPLGLDWGSRKYGLLPRTENGDLHDGRPPTLERFLFWKRIGVHVAGAPRQIFIKLHTHGCKDGNIDMLLGPEMARFHADLAAYARREPRFRYFYVSAWEMAQRIHEIECPSSSKKVSRSTLIPVFEGGGS